VKGGFNVLHEAARRTRVGGSRGTREKNPAPHLDVEAGFGES